MTMHLVKFTPSEYEEEKTSPGSVDEEKGVALPTRL